MLHAINHRALSLPSSLVAIAALFLLQPVGAKATDTDQPTTVRLTLYPSQPPRAALKYRLLPKYLDKQPGNAAVQYLKAVVPESWGPDSPKQFEKLADYLEQPREQFDAVAARKLLDSMNANIFRFTRLGAHRRDCEWDLPIREENYLEILLPDIQSMRQVGRYLALRARVQIAERKIDEAIETLQVGFALAHDVARGPTLIHGLVAVAIGSTMEDQLRELIQLPESPNLYWAIAALPRPFIDLRTAMEMESDGIFMMFPQLKDVDKQQLSEEQWNGKLAEFTAGLSKLMPLMKIGDDGQALQDLTRSFGLSAMTAFHYPRAKAELIAAGWPQKQIDAMPIAQVLLLHVGSTYELLRDESFKWFYVPYWQAAESSITTDHWFKEQIANRREIVPLASLLLPAINPARLSPIRLDRELAALGTVEAIRLYAFEHDGQLPGKLSDLTSTPAPHDPVTGKPFEYEVQDSVATVSGPSPRERSWKEGALRYELTMAKADPKTTETKITDNKVDSPVADPTKQPKPAVDTKVETKQPAQKTADAKSPPAAKSPLGGLFRNPITQARENARRAQSMNNLKQFALAMHVYADTNKHFPPTGSVDKAGKPLLSWRVHVLPFIEQQALYQQFKLDEPWDSETNKKLIDKMPKLFESPSATPLEAGKTCYVVVRGKDTIFHDDKGTRFQDIRDGTSQTILMVEAGPKSAVVWTKPEDIEFDEKDPSAGLLGMREGGFLAAFADGSVRFIAETVGKDSLKAMFTRSAGDAIEQK